MKKPPGRAARPMEIEMGDAPLMLGVSGLRGIVGESLTPEVATNFAGAFGTWLWEQSSHRPMVVVGWDGRAGGESIYNTVTAALQSCGCRVRCIGDAMTPTVGVVCDMSGSDGAVMITASHNPQQWNGLKLLIRGSSWSVESDGRGSVLESQPDACAPNTQTAEGIIKRYRNNEQEWVGSEGRHDAAYHADSVGAHCLRVLDASERLVGECDGDYWSWFEERASFVVVTDAVNCSACEIDEEFFSGSPCRLVPLFSDRSGVFPHTPEPTEENLSGEGGLCDAVPGLKADVGFAQDPDGDRLAIVDEKGGYIGEEYTLVLCAVSVLEAMNGKQDGAQESGDVVLCANLSTSRMIDDVAARYGASVVRTAVGEANVVEAMKKLKKEGKKVVLGGEGNGGVIWPEVTYVRDSLSSMALVLSLMARTGKTVSELVADVPSYAIVKRKQPLAKQEDARPAIERLAAHYKNERVDTQDGVRVDIDSDRSWVHVRASNTEPILRLIAEAPTQERAEAVLDEVQGLVDAG